MSATPPFGNWPPISDGGTPPTPGGDPAFILSTSKEYWLNADSGSDSNDGLTSGTPWKTIVPWNAFLNSYQSVDSAAVATLNVMPSTAVPDFASVQIPALRNNAKIVLRGTTDDPMLNTMSGIALTFVGAAGSTALVTNVTSWNGSNPLGWQMLCTAGNNVGARRTIASWTGNTEGGGPATLTPAAPWDSTTLGDTFHVVKPLSHMNWPAGEVLAGWGTSVIGDGTNDAGVYISQLLLTDTPSFTQISVNFYGSEYLNNTANPGFGVQVSDEIAVTSGISFSPLPWVDPNAGKWNGCCLSERFEALDTTSSDFLATGAISSFEGYLVGTNWIASACTGNMNGGALWGPLNGASVQPTVEALKGAEITVGVGTAIPCFITSAVPTARGVVEAHDADSVLHLQFVDFGSSIPTLLRARDLGVIDCTNTATGTSQLGDGIDATGQGTVTLDYQPTFVASAGAALRVDGLTAANSALASAPSIVRDNATGQSRIVRRSTTTPVASAPAATKQIPFTASVSNYVVPNGMNVVGALGRPGAGGGGGGGGGGAGANTLNGGGGSGGAGAPGGSCALTYFPLWIASGTAIDITCGAGGAGGAGGTGPGVSGSSGSQGGASTIALHGGATLISLLSCGSNSTNVAGNGGLGGGFGSLGTATGGGRGTSGGSGSWPNGNSVANGGPSAGVSGIGGNPATAGSTGTSGTAATGSGTTFELNSPTLPTGGVGGATDGTRGGGGGAAGGIGAAPGDGFVSALGLALPPSSGPGSGQGASPGGAGGAGQTGTGVAGGAGGGTTAAQTGSVGRGGGGGAGGGGGGAGSTTGGTGGAGSAGGAGSVGAWILLLDYA